MSDLPRRKRAAETQLNPDTISSDADINDGEVNRKTDTIDDANAIAARRKVRVVRPTASGSMPTEGTGLFKNIGATTHSPAAGAAPLASAFGFGSNTPSSSGTHSAASGFSFNVKSSSPTGAAPPPAFSFGLPAATAPPVSDGKGEAKPLFGAGAFNFGSAVSSFAEARKKMEEEREKHPGKEDGDAGMSDAGDSEAEQSTPGFGGGSVAVETGESLAVVPCKLFSFDKASKQWIERGIGDAKVKRQRVPLAGDGAGEDFVYRLLVRDGYSLNVTIGKNRLVVSKVEPTHVIFTVPSSEGPVTYLLRFTGPNATEGGKAFAEELNRVVKVVDDTTK